MKKFIVSILVLVGILAVPKAYSFENIVSQDDIEQPKVEKVKEVAEVEPIAKVNFDWLNLNTEERQQKADYYKELLFTNNKSKIEYTSEEFKKTFEKFYKDREFKHHYMLTNNGVTEDEEAKYCPFYYRKGTLVMYAIQYKNTPRKAFYYTAFGKLYYTDLMSDEYPSFPYTSMQYDRKGNLKSAIYFVSKDMQYMYGADKNFAGLWYKEKMYDMEGKEVSSRTKW